MTILLYTVILRPWNVQKSQNSYWICLKSKIWINYINLYVWKSVSYPVSILIFFHRSLIFILLSLCYMSWKCIMIVMHCFSLFAGFIIDLNILTVLIVVTHWFSSLFSSLPAHLIMRRFPIRTGTFCTVTVRGRGRGPSRVRSSLGPRSHTPHLSKHLLMFL